MEPLKRSSGILAPLFSLPGVRDVGSLGRCARAFVDFLSSARQTWFQTLPINPVDSFGSPYAGRSAFAGETLYLDLEDFCAEGLLDAADLTTSWTLPQSFEVRGSSRPQRDARSERINYRATFRRRRPCWQKAFERYSSGRGGSKYRREEERFRAENADWLDDYALFQAATNEFGATDWRKWPEPIRRRDPGALAEFAQARDRELEYARFLQLAFDVQWREFRTYCSSRGVRIFGDVPIYVGGTSVDVWSHPELFQVDADGRVVREAGVPSDDFNKDGQRWGSPVYRWERHKEDNFQWHRRRMKKTLSRFDVVRLDHFIGDYNFYSFPGDGIDPMTDVQGGAPSAITSDGERVYDDGWEPGPQEAFFDAIFSECPREAFVAEDLGVMNKGVETLRDRYGLLGMKVFQFSFDGVTIDKRTGRAPNPITSWPENYVAYTGTHDGAPVLGWLDDVRRFSGSSCNSLDFAGIRDVLERYRQEDDVPAFVPRVRSDECWVSEFFRKPIGFNRQKMGVSSKFRAMAPEIAELRIAALRAVASSACKLAIFPIQDVIGLSNDSRVNYPGVGVGNWIWRLGPRQLDESTISELARLTLETNRI